MRISDWSSDVCSSDLDVLRLGRLGAGELSADRFLVQEAERQCRRDQGVRRQSRRRSGLHARYLRHLSGLQHDLDSRDFGRRSEEHTSELQSLMSTSYAVFCLKKKKTAST